MFTGRIEIPVSINASFSDIRALEAKQREYQLAYPQSIVELVYESEEGYIQVCAECESPDAREVSYGDEGLTVCPDCQSVEQGYKYVKE